MSTADELDLEAAGRGNCSATAWALVAAPDAMYPDAKICHGYPLGRGGDAAGIRYWHAWVEVVIDGGRTICVDLSNNLEVALPRTRYYRLGRIRDVSRFTAAQARAAEAEWGHLGPWDGTFPKATR